MNLNKQKTLKSPWSRVKNQDQTRTKIRTKSEPNQDQIRAKSEPNQDQKNDSKPMKNKPKKQKTEKVHLLLAIKINKTKLSVLGRTFHEIYLYANLPKKLVSRENLVLPKIGTGKRCWRYSIYYIPKCGWI